MKFHSLNFTNWNIALKSTLRYNDLDAENATLRLQRNFSFCQIFEFFLAVKTCFQSDELI